MTPPSKPLYSLPDTISASRSCSRHGGARVGVAALELAGEIHQVVSQDASMPRISAAMVSLSGVGTPRRSPKLTMPPFR